MRTETRSVERFQRKWFINGGNQNLYGCEMLLQARFTMVSQQPGLKDSRLELKKEKALNLNVKCYRHLFYSILLCVAVFKWLENFFLF